MAPVSVKTRKGVVEISVDEHPKPKTTLEGLAKLPSVFAKNGTVTAGTASVSVAPYMLSDEIIYCIIRKKRHEADELSLIFNIVSYC